MSDWLRWTPAVPGESLVTKVVSGTRRVATGRPAADAGHLSARAGVEQSHDAVDRRCGWRTVHP